jgi:16S rRNA (adenine1518-N6/adenine1519-N6)-dimethyltransferase
MMPGPWCICSNLPYYITGPFLASLFRGELPWERAVLLVQAEAAERMAAVPGSKAYGAFTCLVRYHAEVERLLSVPPQAFVPPPLVASAVVRLRRRITPPTLAPREPLLRVVRAAFAHRRKTLRNALAAGLAIPHHPLEDVLAAAGIAPMRRGETLDLVEFGHLTQCLLSAGFLSVIG